MITREELAKYLDQYLNCKAFADYAPNGLQIEGKNEIKRLCTAVTASFEAIEWAQSWQADALLVHHGFFWRGEAPEIIGMKRQRIAALLKQDISLLAYHLPLDCHLELGNNALIAKRLGFNSIQAHKVGNTDNLLWSGKLSKPMDAQAFSSWLETQFKRPPLHIEGHQKVLTQIAWCSGGAQDYIVDAHRLGVDAYLSGEVSERTYYQAKELGIDYFACGHHATERYGIEALGQHLANQFGLTHAFYDSNNPV